MVSRAATQDYVRERKLGQREVFIPLAHPSGHAPDFGKALVRIAGVERKGKPSTEPPAHPLSFQSFF
jgi:hypothetical protein